VINPKALRWAFKKYQSSLQSNQNPVSAKLKKRQNLLASTERKLSRLAPMYMRQKITETQYDELRKPWMLR